MAKATLKGWLGAEAAFLFCRQDLALGQCQLELRLDLTTFVRVRVPNSACSSTMVRSSSFVIVVVS
ncbi:hypothetical protein ACOJBO_03735 [Rhizobium beringeri]